MATEMEKKIVALGKEIGQEGEELRSFVNEQQNLVHEECFIAREAEREAREAEKEQQERQAPVQKEAREAEREQQERQAQLQKEAREAERKQQKIKAQLQREVREHELQLSRIKADQGSANQSGQENPSQTSTGTAKPKLPRFDEKHDDMDIFIERFERFAESQGWNRDEWAVCLSPLLTGKGLQVFSSMPSDEALQYDELKKALLKRYEMTKEGFTNKFRHTKPEQGETTHQFVARLQRYSNRRVDMSGCMKEYKDLADLLIREQFVNICSAEIALFLRERVPKNISEMVKLTEQYLEAHVMSLQEHQKQMKRPSGHHQKSKDQNKTEQNETNKKEGRCYVCHKQGHLAKDCRQDKTQQQGKPTQKAASATMVEEPKEVATIVLCEEVDLGKLQSFVEDGKLRLADGAEIPVLLSACKSGVQMPKRNNLPVSEGYVGDKKVTVLCDTGCTSAVVRRRLGTMDQMTDKKWSCALIDRTIHRLPAAKLQVDTPYYRGELYAMCLEDPIYDLIIGNIQGVQTPSRIDRKEVKMVEKAVGPDVQEGAMPKEHTRELEISEVDSVETVAVTTRAQAEKDKWTIEPLIASSSIPQIGAQ